MWVLGAESKGLFFLQCKLQIFRKLPIVGSGNPCLIVVFKQVNPFVPNVPFLSPWKHQKTLRFLMFSGDRERVHREKMGGLINVYHGLNLWPTLWFLDALLLHLNPFHVSDLFLYQMKTSENQMRPDELSIYKYGRGICKVVTTMSLYLHCFCVNYYKETDVMWICFFCGK